MTPPRFSRVEDWLRWQETLHPKAVDLGLERVRAVGERLGVLRPAPVTLTVGGTNGKGSAVAMLDAVLRAQGYRAGAYLSPHLFHYNERVRIGGQDVSDAELCEAFAAVDAARDQTSLTYFEFGTLAALWLFHRAAVDVALLEVGLGGRLDAVNIVDAQSALITSVGLDHTDWLGPDRDSIGYEKAGIWRRGRAAICGEREPPRGLIEAGERIGADLYVRGRDFDAEKREEAWRWCGRARDWPNLPYPGLKGGIQLDNAAGVLAMLEAVEEWLPVGREAVEQGLRTARLPGRLEERRGTVSVLLDVAHNAEAARVVADYLRDEPAKARNLAVIGMLKDKPVRAVAQALDPTIDAWYAGGLDGERGLSGDLLAARMTPVRGRVSTHRDVASAYQQAEYDAEPGDRIVVLGSFHTLAAVSESARWMK